MSDRDTITLPRKHIDYAAHALEHFNKDAPDPLVSETIHHLRTALAAEQPKPSEDIEALRRDAERWRHWRDSHGFATIDHEKGRCFVTLICDCDDPDQVRAKRFRGEDSFEWLDAFTDAAMKEDKT